LHGVRPARVGRARRRGRLPRSRAQARIHVTVSTEVDPVQLTIVGNYLRTVCHEMGVAMMKTSYSSIFNEGLDFSCVVFDARGQALVSGEFCPAQIGASLFTVQWCIVELGLDAFEEGDVIVHNYTYRGGCHLPEHMLLKPVFW